MPSCSRDNIEFNVRKMKLSAKALTFFRCWSTAYAYLMNMEIYHRSTLSSNWLKSVKYILTFATRPRTLATRKLGNRVLLKP